MPISILAYEVISMNTDFKVQNVTWKLNFRDECSWQQSPWRSSIFGSKLLALVDSNFRTEEGVLQWEIEHWDPEEPTPLLWTHASADRDIMVWEGFLFTFWTDPAILFALWHFNTMQVSSVEARLTKKDHPGCPVLICHRQNRGPWGQGVFLNVTTGQ